MLSALLVSLEAKHRRFSLWLGSGSGRQRLAGGHPTGGVGVRHRRSERPVGQAGRLPAYCANRWSHGGRFHSGRPSQAPGVRGTHAWGERAMLGMAGGRLCGARNVPVGTPRRRHSLYTRTGGTISQSPGRRHCDTAHPRLCSRLGVDGRHHSGNGTQESAGAHKRTAIAGVRERRAHLARTPQA